MKTILTKTRKPCKPSSGAVRVLRPVGAVNDTAGEILLNGKPYYLALRGSCYTLTGFCARRGVVSYDLPADLSSCDCPDGEFREERPGGCKHRKALAALRGAGKLPDLHPEASYKPGHSSDLPF